MSDLGLKFLPLWNEAVAGVNLPATCLFGAILLYWALNETIATIMRRIEKSYNRDRKQSNKDKYTIDITKSSGLSR